ncbi:MAG TPA: type II toxin-antitoxin system RelE/ParE family toxin [Gallionella sp.]|nr:type II toxin-antitoxin system RelE/ParE family toxin [Gallionella sp.]
MSYKVLLTQGAERDLEVIYDYIAENDTRASADYVLDKPAGKPASLSPALSRKQAREQTNRCTNFTLSEVAGTLAAFPERGSHPKELLALGIREYRQMHFKPYRLIYRVSGKQVIVYIIADGRRDMQTLLMQGMLGG